MHHRQLLREKIKEVLGALPTFQGRCHINRARPFAQADLPALCIYTRRSAAERHIDQWRDKKTCTLELELHAGGTDPEVLAADIDTLCLLIEHELFKSQTLGGLFEEIEHKGDEIETDAEGELVTIHCRMSFEVQYVFENTVDAPAFTLAGIEWDVTPVDGNIAATDELTLPQ